MDTYDPDNNILSNEEMDKITQALQQAVQAIGEASCYLPVKCERQIAEAMNAEVFKFRTRNEQRQST